MSVVTLAEAKRYLRTISTADDELIQELIDAAENECMQYLDRPSLPRIGVDCPAEADTAFIDDPVSDGSDFPPSLRRGILLIVQAGYEAPTADEMMKIRSAAEIIWAPYRCKRGV